MRWEAAGSQSSSLRFRAIPRDSVTYRKPLFVSQSMTYASYKMAAILTVLMTTIQREKERGVPRRIAKKKKAFPFDSGRLPILSLAPTSPCPKLCPWLPPRRESPKACVFCRDHTKIPLTRKKGGNMNIGQATGISCCKHIQLRHPKSSLPIHWLCSLCFQMILL